MTDLQNRLRVVKNRADEIKAKHTSSRVPDDSDEIAVLCYLVSYLAGIIESHFDTGEV